MISITCPKRPKYIFDFALFACEYLKINRLNRDLDIIIRNRIEDDHEGVSYGDRDQVTIEIAKNSYEDRLDKKMTLIALAHEIVHAKQYFREELKDTAGTTYWKGEPFLMKEFYISENGSVRLQHERMPWEAEAYKLETEIYDAYCKRP